MTIQPRLELSSRIAASAAGAGLKPEHFERIMATRPDCGFFEIHAENYMNQGGANHRWLARLSEIYPLSVHGVGLSLGSVEPLDPERLARLARVVALYRPALVSEHLAWSDFSGRAFPDLLPLPYDEAALRRVADKIDATQTALGRRILVENPATYLRFPGDGIAEPQFLAELCALSGCGLLLDVNNVHVSAVNHGFYAEKYLDAFPLDRVEEMHLAGFTEARDARGPFLIDTHGGAVSDEVWALYEHVLRRAGPRPTLIEWDSDVPEWELLFAETRKARGMLGAVPSPLAGEGGSPKGETDEGAPGEGVKVEDAGKPPSSGASRHPLPPQGVRKNARLSTGYGEKGTPTPGTEHWQSQFAAALQDPALPPPQIFAECDLSARFAVYRNNSAVAAIDALKEQFPTLLLLVGDEAFSGLARHFVQEQPPRSPVLGDYGAHLPAFLETFLSQCEGGDATPYLADSARLDWACLQARRASEATPCDATRLTTLDPARVAETRLVLHPSLALVASPWPILGIGNSHVAPVKDWRAETVVVLRPWAELVRQACPRGQAAFLRACIEGENLGEAARRALEQDEHFDFGQTLVELTQLGAIVDFAA